MSLADISELIEKAIEEEGDLCIEGVHITEEDFDIDVEVMIENGSMYMIYLDTGMVVRGNTYWFDNVVLSYFLHGKYLEKFVNDNPRFVEKCDSTIHAKGGIVFLDISWEGRHHRKEIIYRESKSDPFHVRPYDEVPSIPMSIYNQLIEYPDMQKCIPFLVDDPSLLPLIDKNGRKWTTDIDILF